MAMTMNLMRVLEAERARQFAGLAGTHIDATLPVRQVALDTALAGVPRWPTPIESLSVSIEAGNVLLVSAGVRVFGFGTQVRLRLRLHPALEQGVVRLSLDEGSFVASALSWAGPLLARLPPGITLDGRQISVDVQRLAGQQGVGDLARMLSAATFTSDEGVLWIAARVEVTQGDAQPDAAQAPTLPAPHGPSVSLDDLRAWLHGAQVSASLRVDERLANDLVAAVHADAQRASEGVPNTVGAVAARALRGPTVQFEAGAMRLTAHAVLEPRERAR